MKSRLFAMALGLVLAGLFLAGGCPLLAKTGPQQPGSVNDEQVASQGMEEVQHGNIPVTLVLQDRAGKPLSNQLVNLISTTGPMEVRTDAEGQAKFMGPSMFLVNLGRLDSIPAELGQKPVNQWTLEDMDRFGLYLVIPQPGSVATTEPIRLRVADNWSVGTR